MPFQAVRPHQRRRNQWSIRNRWRGVVDNSEFGPSGVDAPSPWTLEDDELMDGLGYDLRLNRTMKRPSQVGVDFATWSTTGNIGSLFRAVGAGYDKLILVRASAGAGNIAHLSGGNWAQVAYSGGSFPNAGAGPIQPANGLGKTLIGFGGTGGIAEYDGSTFTNLVGTSIPTGAQALLFFRLSNRFLAVTGQDDVLLFSANGDRTAWGANDFVPGGFEPIGNDRHALVTLAEGPGDLTTCLKHDYVFVIEKADPLDWNVRRKASDRGVLGVNAWCIGPDGAVIFAHETGIWVMGGDGGILGTPLTTNIQLAWLNMVTAYPAGLKNVGLEYHRRNEELYVFVPTGDAQMPRRLWRCYLPDLSWMPEEEITTGNVFYSFPAWALDATTGTGHVYYADQDLTGGTDRVWQLNATGARVGAFLQTKPLGDQNITREFGVAPEAPAQSQQALVTLKARGSYNAHITPIIWQDDGGVVVGDAQTLDLSGVPGRGKVFEVQVPNDVGQGLSLTFANAGQDEIFDVESITVPHTDRTFGPRRG
jgi:hypothetical protein